jgi:2OG-Fe(II) oxygenase superfamily
MERLAELNPKGEWWLHKRPFRHIRAERVFRKDVYQSLETAFLALRDADATNAEGELRFRQGQRGYDAFILAMRQNLAPRFAPLFEQRWIEFLADLLDLPALAQIDGALHHIPINSRSGWVHNDFCSGWFDGEVTGDIVFPDHRNCDYFTGTAKSREAQPQEFIRAATMIFYLQNDGWKEGCGGETGLYASRVGSGEMCMVAPLNNSLLLFECSPHSYHALIANPGCQRNSIILWLHSSVENAQSRWGRAFTRRKPK